MAASDLAALFASIGISFWTQRSFKQPLIFSAVACLAGTEGCAHCYLAFAPHCCARCHALGGCVPAQRLQPGCFNWHAINQPCGAPIAIHPYQWLLPTMCRQHPVCAELPVALACRPAGRPPAQRLRQRPHSQPPLHSRLRFQGSQDNGIGRCGRVECRGHCILAGNAPAQPRLVMHQLSPSFAGRWLSSHRWG